MRKEVLRMEHILCLDNGVSILNYLSMQIFQGEIYGVLCLEQPGIDKMIELICWNRPIQTGQIFFGEKLVNRAGIGDNSRNKVAVIGRQCQLIDDLSLADNLYVIRPGFRQFVIPQRLIRSETRKLFDSLQIALNPDTLVKEIGNYGRLIIEILRAIVVGDHLIILWEISDLLSSEELPRFHELIRRLAQKGHTFLYIYSHHEVLRPVSDRLAVFEGGCIEKVIHRKETTKQLVTGFFARYAYDWLMKNRPDGSVDFQGAAPVLELKNLTTKSIRNINLHLRAGENVLLLDQSNTIFDELIDVLAGIDHSYTGRITPSGVTNSSKHEIGLISRDPIHSNLFPEMSFLDNLCFPLSQKYPLFWQSTRLRRSVMKECWNELGELLDAPELYHLSKKDLYTLVYFRYLLSKPKVLICHQPLADTDVPMRIHILGLLSKLRSRGIAVLVLNTELYDTLQIADRLVQVENGRIISEHTRSHFDEAKMIREDLFPD